MTRPSLIREATRVARLIRANPMHNGMYLQAQFEGLATLIEELVKALEAHPCETERTS